MYKVVIGLETHCEISSKTKNFSSAPNFYSSYPNQNVSAIDLGLPGILPTANREASKKAIKTAVALNCTIADEIIFDRKNYYYPDLPKGYQITQMTKPMGINGNMKYFVNDEEKEVLIHDLHLEEDTASLDHYDDYSLIDYNRAGIPLMEIVTEPCIHSADEAIAYLENLRNLIIYCGVSEARSDKGQMRSDVNVSLMKEDATELGTKVEMKNINSFYNVRLAIEAEIERQTAILNRGEKVAQETRRLGDDGKTYSMREKVDAIDYKYYLEPNIPPIKIDNKFITEIKSELPELQYQRIKRYMDLGINLKEASILTKDLDISSYFDEILSKIDNVTLATNWMVSIVLGSLNKLEINIKDFFITSEMLANIISLVEKGDLSQLNAKEILATSIEKEKDPMEIIKETGIKQITNEDDLLVLIKEVFSENEIQVNQYLNGNEKLANFLVGKVMQKSNKQANPSVTLSLIIRELDKIKK